MIKLSMYIRLYDWIKFTTNERAEYLETNELQSGHNNSTVQVRLTPATSS